MKSQALLVSARLLALICLMRFEFARQKEIPGDDVSDLQTPAGLG